MRCAKAYRLQRITGGPDVFTVDAVGDYGGQQVYVTSIIEFPPQQDREADRLFRERL